jgi:hypothetical protein
VRAKIHRTRSEHRIGLTELPESGELTVRLADTRPDELKLRAPHVIEVDERLYVEENNRRCQTWLASIEAAEPLDDVGYNRSTSSGSNGSNNSKNMATTSSSSANVSLEAVNVEVPDETFSWAGDECSGPRGEGGTEGRRREEGGGGGVRKMRSWRGPLQLKPPINTSASSSDSDVLLQRVLATSGYRHLAGRHDNKDDQHGESPKGRQGGDVSIGSREGGDVTDAGSSVGAAAGRGWAGLRPPSSRLDVHGTLASKHDPPFPEHSGLE